MGADEREKPNAETAELFDRGKQLARGRRIRDLRIESGMSQPYYAEKLHTRLRNYQRIEKKGTHNFRHIESLAQAFSEVMRREVDPIWLWTGKKEDPADTVAQRLDR